MLNQLRYKLANLDEHMLEVLTGAGLAFALRGIGALLAFILNIAIGRLLGAEGAGLYFLALSVTSIGAVIARLGLDNTLLRFIASGASQQDWGQVKGVFSLGMKFAGATSLALSLTCFVLASWLAETVFKEQALTNPLRWMSFGIFSAAMMTLVSESLKGLKRISGSMLVAGVLYPLFALLLIWPLIKILGVTGASMAYVLGTGAAAFIGVLYWRTATVNYHVAAKPFSREILWASSRPLWFVSIINGAIIPWLPIMFVGYWATPSDVGILGAATRLVTVLTFFLVAVNTVLSPKISALSHHGQLETLGTVVRHSSILILLAASPIFIFFIFLSESVMGLFGADFIQGANILVILAIGQLFATFLGPGGFVLALSGYETKVRTAALVSGLVLVFLCFVLVPAFGVIGAATASAISLVVDRAIGSYFVWKYMGIITLALPK